MWPRVFLMATSLLLHRADAIGLTGAAFLAGTDVMAVASAVGGDQVGEGIVDAFRINVDAITDRRAEFFRVTQNSGHRAGRDTDHIVDRTAAVGESAEVAGQNGQTLLLSDRRRRNTGVEPHQVSNRTAIIGT